MLDKKSIWHIISLPLYRIAVCLVWINSYLNACFWGILIRSLPIHLKKVLYVCMFLVSLTLSGCSWYTWLCLGVVYILDYVWVFLIYLTMSGCSLYTWLCLGVLDIDYVWMFLISLTMSGCSWCPWLCLGVPDILDYVWVFLISLTMTPSTTTRTIFLSSPRNTNLWTRS